MMESEARGTVCKGFGEGMVGRDPCFVQYCVELSVGFLSWLILVLSVCLALWLHCYSCVRFAVVHPSVHGNNPDAARALQWFRSVGARRKW